MEVRQIPRSHRRDAIGVMVQAFWDYPEAVHLLPDDRIRRRVLPAYLASDCRESRRHGLLLGAFADGSVRGVLAAIPPGAYPVPVRRQVAQAIQMAPIAPWGLSALREARSGQAANRAAHPHEPHFWIQSLGVAPRVQRTGAGRALVSSILRRADDRLVGTYLSTARLENVAYYEALGFTVRSTYHPTPAWPQVWAMWRDPR